MQKRYWFWSNGTKKHICFRYYAWWMSPFFLR